MGIGTGRCRCKKSSRSQSVRFDHGTRYATVCVRLLWLTPSRGTSIMTVYTGVSCLLQTYCLVADVSDLAHSCNDPTSRGRRSRGLVGNQSLACHWSGIKSEVDPRALVLLVAVVRRPRCSALYSHVYVAKTETFVRTVPRAYLSHQARRRRHRVH